MSVTPTIQNVKPVVGGSADVWGGIINDRIGEAYVDITAIATQFNATQTIAASAQATAAAALARAGGTMTGQLVLANTGPASQYAAGFRGSPVIDFTGVKVLVLTEAGKMVRLTGASSGAVQIPAVASVPFPVGTVIELRNASTGNLTIQDAGGGVTLRLAGSATTGDRGMTPQGMARLVHEATNVWVITNAVGVS